MLYTSVPIDRIYNNQVNSLIIPRNNISMTGQESDIKSDSENNRLEVKMIDIEHGKVYARREGDNYVVDSISSTCLSDYLTEDYKIGSIIDIK